jgi:hypothetical protein
MVRLALADPKGRSNGHLRSSLHWHRLAFRWSRTPSPRLATSTPRSLSNPKIDRAISLHANITTSPAPLTFGLHKHGNFFHLRVRPRQLVLQKHFRFWLHAHLRLLEHQRKGIETGKKTDRVVISGAWFPNKIKWLLEGTRPDSPVILDKELLVFGRAKRSESAFEHAELVLEAGDKLGLEFMSLT